MEMPLNMFFHFFDCKSAVIIQDDELNDKQFERGTFLILASLQLAFNWIWRLETHNCKDSAKMTSLNDF